MNTEYITELEAQREALQAHVGKLELELQNKSAQISTLVLRADNLLKTAIKAAAKAIRDRATGDEIFVENAVQAAADAIRSLQPTQSEECVQVSDSIQKELAKKQPCGCVICTCEDDEYCHGCGAKYCGTHPPHQLPNPVYTDNTQDTPQPDSWMVKHDVQQMLYQGYSIGVNHHGDPLLLKDGYEVAIINEVVRGLNYPPKVTLEGLPQRAPITEWLNKMGVGLTNEQCTQIRQWPVYAALSSPAATQQNKNDLVHEDSGKLERLDVPSNGSVPAYPEITLNGYQLKEALEFIAPDGDDDQMQCEITIANLPAHKAPLDDDDKRMHAGIYAWITDYPEEGCIPLLEEPQVVSQLTTSPTLEARTDFPTEGQPNVINGIAAQGRMQEVEKDQPNTGEPCTDCKGAGSFVDVVDGERAEYLCNTCNGSGYEPKTIVAPIASQEDVNTGNGGKQPEQTKGAYK